MPTLIVLLLVISVSYQMFFRFDHWVDPHHPEVVYERDNLTGLMHRFDPTRKVSLVNRITGHYPGSASQHTNTTHPQEAITALAVTTQPVTATHHNNHPVATTAPPQGEATGTMGLLMTEVTPASPQQRLPAPQTHVAAPKKVTTTAPKAAPKTKPVAQTVIAAPTPTPSVANPSTPKAVATTQPNPFTYTEQGADFNRDGNAEKITLARSGNGTQTEITILEGQREIFYGKGQRLQMLATRRHGWNDIALITPNGHQRLYGYDPLSQGYEPLPSNGTALSHR